MKWLPAAAFGSSGESFHSVAGSTGFVSVTFAARSASRVISTIWEVGSPSALFTGIRCGRSFPKPFETSTMPKPEPPPGAVLLPPPPPPPPPQAGTTASEAAAAREAATTAERPPLRFAGRAIEAG